MKSGKIFEILRADGKIITDNKALRMWVSATTVAVANL